VLSRIKAVGTTVYTSQCLSIKNRSSIKKNEGSSRLHYKSNNWETSLRSLCGINFLTYATNFQAN
jgi:hypothetical protein